MSRLYTEASFPGGNGAIRVQFSCDLHQRMMTYQIQLSNMVNQTSVFHCAYQGSFVRRMQAFGPVHTQPERHCAGHPPKIPRAERDEHIIRRKGSLFKAFLDVMAASFT